MSGRFDGYHRISGNDQSHNMAGGKLNVLAVRKRAVFNITKEVIAYRTYEEQQGVNANMKELKEVRSNAEIFNDVGIRYN